MKNTPAIVTCRKHWSAFIPTGIISLTVVVVGVAAGTHAGNPATALGCIVIAALILGADILATNMSRLTITSTEVTGRVGVLHSVKLTAPISRVQDVSISNGVLGKLLGYHTIIVTTAGTGGQEFVFKGFCNGPEFKQTFLTLAS